MGLPPAAGDAVGTGSARYEETAGKVHPDMLWIPGGVFHMDGLK